MADDSTRPPEPQPGGCLFSILNALVRGILNLLGLGVRGARATIIPPDARYREFVDAWVSERLAAWLHETRSEIDTDQARLVLMGEAERFPAQAAMLRQTLLDAKVTFSQRDGKQYLEIEAYMAPRQTNGRQPQVLRWRAEREIAWPEIPDDVRERLIRSREPVTLGYAIPQ